MAKKVKRFIKIGIIVLCLLPVMYIIPFAYLAATDYYPTHIAGSYYYDEQHCTIIDIYNGKDNPPDCNDNGSHRKSNNTDIPPVILGYKTNGKYITAMQKSGLKQKANLALPDEYSKYIQISNYWIIDVKAYTRIGPLDYQLFIAECKKRHMSQDMIFE